MANDIEIRKLVASIANLERTMDRQNRVLQNLTKEIQRGNQAAEARGRRNQAAADARGGEEDRVVGSTGGQVPESLRQSAPSPGGFTEAQQRNEGQKVAVNTDEGRVFMTQAEATAYFESKRPIHGE